MGTPNVVPPAPNQPSTVAGAPDAQSILAQAQQPDQSTPPPVQYTPPVTTQPTFFGHLLSGILAGLAGGVRGATEDSAAAGHGQTQGNGAAYGLQELQKVQQQQAADQQQKTAAAQQEFDNQLKSRQASQSEQLNAARLTAAHLDALQTAQKMSQLPAEQQDAYYKGQDAAAEQYGRDRTAIGDFPDQHAALAYLQSQGKNLSDVLATHHQAADGQDHITLWPTGASVLSSKDINARLHNTNDHVPDGVTMKEIDAVPFINGRNAKDTDAKTELQRQQVLEAQRAQDELARQKQQQGFTAAQNAADRNASAAKSSSNNAQVDPAIERTVDALRNHLVYPDQVGSGMGKDAANFREKVNLRALEKYPDMDLANLKQQAADAQKTGTQTSIKSARTLFGTQSTPGTLDTFEDILKALPHSALGPAASEAEQAIAYHTGAPSMANFKAARFDVGQEAAKYLAGPGGTVTDEKAKGAIDQFQNANTESSARAAFQTLRTLMSERHRGIIGNNPYLANQAADIPDPRIARQPLVQHSPSTKRERRSYDGGKTWLETPQ